MRITYLFLPLYFGLFAGLVGHSVRVGLVGAAVGLILAVLLSAEGNRRGRTDGMAAIDAMTGTEFEDYVAARLQRAGWRVQFTPASGDYGVDLIGDKDGKSVAVQCKRLGKPVGVAAVQQVVHEEHRHQQSGIHGCGQTTGPYPQLSIDRPQSAASLGTASCATRGLGLARSRAKANSEGWRL
jgi:restriction system protein